MESKRTDLKRRIALWLCPELGQELKKVTDHNECLQGNIDKLCEALGKANTRAEEHLNDLNEALADVLKLTAELHIKEKELKKAHRHKTIKPRKV